MIDNTGSMEDINSKLKFQGKNLDRAKILFREGKIKDDEFIAAVRAFDKAMKAWEVKFRTYDNNG